MYSISQSTSSFGKKRAIWRGVKFSYSAGTVDLYWLGNLYQYPFPRGCQHAGQFKQRQEKADLGRGSSTTCQHSVITATCLQPTHFLVCSHDFDFQRANERENQPKKYSNYIESHVSISSPLFILNISINVFSACYQ